MSDEHTVLVLGGTGRTGGGVLEQLLSRGVAVRAIVRSAGRLPAGAAGHAGLTVVEADLLSLSDDGLRRHVAGCDAVISCLGHVMSLKGMFGAPRDLVTRATTRVCQAIQALRPAEPVRLVLMSSVSVNRPGGLDTRRAGRWNGRSCGCSALSCHPPGTTRRPRAPSTAPSGRPTRTCDG